jgi:ubiquinone/menaquinone biosynthesis C-methylase UbiE
MADQQSDYEKRNVDYTLIHGETKEVYSKFIEVLRLKTGSKLLDIGGGYGSVLLNILENNPQLSFNYHLLENSLLQINKAKKYLDNYVTNHGSKVKINYINQDASEINLPDNTYDVVVCKMFIHEIPQHKKERIFKKIYSLLKHGGDVIFWNPNLNENDFDFYVSTIRKKDKLAKFNTLAENRCFLLNSELIEYLENVGFSDIKKLFDFDYNLHTSLRLKSEFHDKIELLNEWNDYILKCADLLPYDLRNTLIIDVSNHNVHIRFKRAVFKANKV